VPITTPASFTYDALGRRQRKTITGAITDFVYDGLNPVREATGATIADLLTGLGIDEYLTRTTGGGTEHYLIDPVGSTVALTSGTGAVQTEYSYEPFGTAAAGGASSGNELRYTGREDDGTGLYYYRARYYHPGLQRFIAEDPIGFAGGDVNLYAYVFNNPANFTDPLGLDGVKDDCSYAGIGCDDGPPPLGGRKDPGVGPGKDSGVGPGNPGPPPVDSLPIVATGFLLAGDLDVDVGLLDFCRKIA
jgi:RHS repeat-associated protein